MESPLVVEVELHLYPGTDVRAPGGAVTAGLCGHWDHDGPCRWPHNNRLDIEESSARFRTIVIVAHEDRDEVLRRIEVALRGDERWRVAELEVRAVNEDEQQVAERLSRAT